MKDTNQSDELRGAFDFLKTIKVKQKAHFSCGEIHNIELKLPVEEMAKIEQWIQKRETEVKLEELKRIQRGSRVLDRDGILAFIEIELQAQVNKEVTK